MCVCVGGGNLSALQKFLHNYFYETKYFYKLIKIFSGQ